MAAAQADVDYAKAALDEANIYLDRTVIRSPVKGLVVARRVDAGQVRPRAAAACS